MPADEEKGNRHYQDRWPDKEEHGAGLNDLLNVKKIDCRQAKSVTLMPLGNSNITVDKEFCDFVKIGSKAILSMRGTKFQ